MLLIHKFKNKMNNFKKQRGFKISEYINKNKNTYVSKDLQLSIQTKARS